MLEELANFGRNIFEHNAERLPGCIAYLPIRIATKLHAIIIIESCADQLGVLGSEVSSV